MQADVVIIGAGLAGLAAGVALTDAGLRVTVVERDALPGGRARSMVDERTQDVVDVGPHVLMSEYRNMLALLERLGTRTQVTWQREKFVTLVDGGRAETMRVRRLPAPLHFLPDLLRSRSVSGMDLLSNRRVLWLAFGLDAHDIARLDGIAARDLLQQLGVSPRFIAWYWATLAMTIMNAPLERCSAGALLRYFQQMITHSGYCFGFAAQGLGEIAALPAVRAIEAPGGRVLPGAAARAISTTQDAFTGVCLDDGTLLPARACIAAVPPRELHALLPSHWRRRRDFCQLEAFEPCPYLSTYLWFDRKLTHERFWTRTWNPRNLNYDFYDLSNIRDGWRQRASLIASNAIWSAHAQMLDDNAIIARTRAELAQFIPAARDARILHARVHRIPMSIPAPLVGSEHRRMQTATPVRGLFLAGDWTDTGLPASMESAVLAGNRAAEGAAEFLDLPLRIALPMRPMEGLARLLHRYAAKRGP